jgi:hypothetical protein
MASIAGLVVALVTYFPIRMGLGFFFQVFDDRTLWWQDWLFPSIALSGAAAAFYFTRKWVKNRRRFLGRDDRRSDCFPELVTITSARG